MIEELFQQATTLQPLQQARRGPVLQRPCRVVRLHFEVNTPRCAVDSKKKRHEGRSPDLRESAIANGVPQHSASILPKNSKRFRLRPSQCTIAGLPLP